MTGRVADAAPTDLIQSVSRALRILEEVARSPRPLPVKVIARRCRLNVSTAYHLTLLATMDGRGRRRVLAAHGMRPFTRCTPIEPDQVEDELVRLRPGDLVREYGQFRDQVCCAGMAIPGPRRDSWWALGASARGLSLPSPLLTELRLAATDLAASAEHATGA